jgi:eukaryotic-like serine/threonine-protein kinase
MFNFFGKPKDLTGKMLCKRYKITQCLGSGGFGDTYLATDTRSKNQLIRVVKHFNPKGEIPKDQRKYFLSKLSRAFETEKAVLERLGEEHPHRQIPRMVDHFEQWKEFFYVQEFVDGIILKEEIKNRLSEVKVRALITDLLEVLDFVHKQGVVHRDIKPENIIRRKNDNRLVLIDFGAVKELDKLLSSNRQIISSLVIGTRGYMSAEQANGRPCYASDIYSVGMIGIQCLVGRHPRNIALDDKLQPKWRDLAIVSSKFAAILDRMTSYRPAERYPNAGEALKVMQALQRPEASEWMKESQKLNPPNQPHQSVTTLQEEKGKLSSYSLLSTANAVSTVTKPRSQPPEITVNYEGLEQLLKLSDWRGADEMTTKLILKLADCQGLGYLEMPDIQKLTSQSIKRIDHLWNEYSNGHFGFSVQKQFWQTCGAPDDYNKDWEKFADLVGWRSKGGWRAYHTLYFSLKCTRGMLPNPNLLFGLNFISAGRSMYLIYSQID